MFLHSNIFCFILFDLVIAPFQINLYQTDWVSNDKNNCLHVGASIKNENDPHQIISYCLTESSSKFDIQLNNFNQKFTFIELYKQNITSQQLYLWSAPIDVIERYQLYLNQLSISNDLSLMANQSFYNCTSPRFGPLCQYELDNYDYHYSSLNEFIYDYYQQKYEPTTLTCYTHLKCDRGFPSICLDWTEICDGIVDCRNGIDEESCWQFKINKCKDYEYQCDNGQCIHHTFFDDGNNDFECLDKSDDLKSTTQYDVYNYSEPTFAKEDTTCPLRNQRSMIRHTSSCVPFRSGLLEKLMFSDKPDTISDYCWLAAKCRLSTPYTSYSVCHNLSLNGTWQKILNQTCPHMLFMPAGPVLFGHIHFLYTEEELNWAHFVVASPRYVCYSDQFCDGFYSNRTLLSFNNMTCRHPADFPISFESLALSRGIWNNMYVEPIYRSLYHCNTNVYNGLTNCDSLTMYKCINSTKCISRHQFCDDRNDCDYKDDEQCPVVNDTYRKCDPKTQFECTTNNICIPLVSVQNGKCDCQYDENGFCDDEYPQDHYIRKYVSFSTICDGFTELIPVTINERNETDETECEYWQCNNTYTRCDGFWNCFDGSDEVDCYSSLFHCPYHHHICVSPQTNQFICLPLEKANDGNIDCLGATDELKLCRYNNHALRNENFHCKNTTIQSCIHINKVCDGRKNCEHGDDEQVCDKRGNFMIHPHYCWEDYDSIISNIEKFFCARQFDTKKLKIKHFSLGELPNSMKYEIQQDTSAIFLDPIIGQKNIPQYYQQCHRGLPLRIWFNDKKNLTNITCLCPPSFYGNMCQYQNQRVSLTLQFQTYSDSRRTIFTVIVSLIDDINERIIHSYQQFTYLYIEHCRTKFNIYLLYSTRPKLLTNNYSIHIDIYEKISFKYRGSFLIPVKYPFLPVHRFAVQFNIPRTGENIERCSDLPCVHGYCIRYMNGLKDTSFCQCDKEWSGKYCTIQYKCICSSDSLCIGISANNRSICICPLNKWGSQCLLHNTICNSNKNLTCQNGGQCIPVDEIMVFNKQIICICPKGYNGERCEIADNKIIVSFHKDISLPHTMLVHFIRVIDNGPPENGSTFSTIPVNQKSITIFWSRPFHIAYIQLFDNDYFLVTVQKTYTQSAIIFRTINPFDRCKHISEVLNETIVNLHILRRIKYYHLPCQNRSSQLSCFYDNIHFCLCYNYDNQRLANCFEFNHSIEHNCFGESNCENGAKCLQDKLTCPQTSMCVCPKCFYGTQCQFSSTLFGLSLDAILGYHIQPNIDIKHQLPIVKVSVTLTIILIVTGFINGILSLMTFKSKKTRKIGSGFYLLGSSITTLFTMTMFTLKFWIFLLVQIKYETNRSFLYVQCVSIDFLLRIGLNMDQWLNACVAIERAITALKGTSFNKQKSKQMAKYVIVFLLLLTISTIIHDPIHRRLIDDLNNDDEKRIWCIVTYSSGLQMFNLIINVFHFMTPFIINLISAFIVVKKTAEQKQRAQRHETYWDLFYKQFREHSHLFVAPVVLVILAIPRLIITFTSGCMKSNDDAWLYLIGYFISFIPCTLTFFVFVPPSKLYKDEFYKSVKQFRQQIRNRLYQIA